ncbi:PEP-CTERM sorting domain-containing protein [Telluria aromaticivorans]|uniref:PEP-CTERM sorting domain-containing protein n=1 Tax=Telluria aromaticivorans TaxID=2725995 RepID=A0A7Y2K103_9BURK|nr:PEP-CTERM sorting domain-containing protein [Telluria aromaticivorans]NNG24692.1 PEP-CTERM sorting domain-containing protein [Telluria aromaticivorans]
MNTLQFGKLKQLACAAALCLGSVQGASAGIIFSKTVPAVGTVTNVRFGLPGSTPGPDTTVTGTAGPLKNRFLIDFTSNERLIANVDDAPPLVRALDGSFQQLDVSVRDAVFTTLFLNFHTVGGTNNAATRYADIVVSAFGGETASYRLNFSANANANNFFRVDATDGTLLNNVSISSMIGITDVRQPRIAARIPEPATLLSLGIGMAGLVAVRRRKRPAAAAPGAVPGSAIA